MSRYSEWEATSASGESGADSASAPSSGLLGRCSLRSGSLPGGCGSTVLRSSLAGGDSLGSMSGPPFVAHPLPAPGCVHTGLDSERLLAEGRVRREPDDRDLLVRKDDRRRPRPLHLMKIGDRPSNEHAGTHDEGTGRPVASRRRVCWRDPRPPPRSGDDSIQGTPTCARRVVRDGWSGGRDSAHACGWRVLLGRRARIVLWSQFPRVELLVRRRDRSFGRDGCARRRAPRPRRRLRIAPPRVRCCLEPRGENEVGSGSDR